MRLPALFLLALAGPALAQGVTADLDGDGAPESYALRDNGQGSVDLVVTAEGGERVAPAVAWTGELAGQRPELALSPAGSLLLTSMNDSVGRDRWTLTLTLAHRDGDLRVAGITYGWRDTLEPAAGGGCDLNLLTGRGVASGPDGEREIAAPSPAPPIWEWREAELPRLLPAECFG